MFLLNNCKILIFSDVRHGPTAPHKRQELVNFGIQKSGCGCVCTCSELGRGDRLGTGWFWPVRLWPGSEATVTNSDSGVAVAVGSSTLAKILPNSKVLLSNKIPAETQTEIKKECKGKIPKSRLHLRAAGPGEQHGLGTALAGLCPAPPQPARPPKRPPKFLWKDSGDWTNVAYKYKLCNKQTWCK